MINYLAKKITNHYIKKNSIQEEEREIYEYCFDVMISTLLNLIAIAIISISMGLYIEGTIFCIVFMSLRGIGGGYHAKTHFFCFMTIMIVFAIYVLMLKLLGTTILFYISIAFLIIGFIIIAILAPVDTETKPLTQAEFKKNKIKTLILLFIYTIIASILLIFNQTQYYSFNVVYPIFAVSNLMIIGAIKNREWKRTE